MTRWQRLPVAVRAILAGGAIAAAGTIPWALLVAANQKVGIVVPWSSLVMAVYLWFLWRYIGGDGWPRSTSHSRCQSLRANPLSEDVWGSALVAGALGLGALVAGMSVASRLVRLPAEQTEDLSRIPMLTLAVSLIMSSIVAGVVEESAFRGYVQGPIEKRHGPVVAILITGSLFGFAHFTHPEVTMILLPYYMGVATIYGMLAYLTHSIFPSMILHAGGNILGFLQLMAGGRAEWQAPATPAPLVWETGPDATLWVSCIVTVVLTGGAIWAYVTLAAVTRESVRPPGLSSPQIQPRPS